MLISAPKVRVVAEMASLAAARPMPAPVREKAGLNDGRTLAGLAALGIESPALRALVRVEPSASAMRIANDPSGRFAHVAIYFDRLLEALRRDNPDMPESSARHIAQTETIIANRGIFPPSALFLYPEIGEAGTRTAAETPGDSPPVATPETSYGEWD
jgi:hypothetical protein